MEVWPELVLVKEQVCIHTWSLLPLLLLPPTPYKLFVGQKSDPSWVLTVTTLLTMFRCLGMESLLAYIIFGRKATLAKALWSGLLQVVKPLASESVRVVIEANLLSVISLENVEHIIRISPFKFGPSPLIAHYPAILLAVWGHLTPLAPGRCDWTTSCDSILWM